MGDKDDGDKSEVLLPGSPSGKKPTSVLYLCNHNIIRSPMAEAITRKYFRSKIFSASAGVGTGSPDPFVDAVLNELNIDVHNRAPQALEQMDEGYFDLIVTLSPTAHQVALKMAHVEAAEIEYWPSADPTVAQGSRAQMLDAYRDVRDRLKDRILERFSDTGPSGNGSPT